MVIDLNVRLTKNDAYSGPDRTITNCRDLYIEYDYKYDLRNPPATVVIFLLYNIYNVIIINFILK